MFLENNYEFSRTISSIQDIDHLMDKKESIKNQIMEYISWEERMALYQQVQIINKRIREIKDHTVVRHIS
ncbi:hypothetical protein [Ammoniphilus sp. CFH 90114]|uniref:hypothetical protein n=1 Tax=Ammoniphilus sp. CFH 90114 TaxID=2493665 RepID=UPI00100F4C63|nr:hypothetical protein [Ammoniphilus sp. CFH 90114]RXT15441.1 hypothetical protein EIZ39_04390 [Ammoniphilus sp. CFH 90114]